ncbi:4-carboxy-4-hydroxy-2-oxoadipate aldolase/oxaloacetate decarboxylase [Staphylococcus nepalensis]|uniref:4-carboxy-4-hydroxy-2-oxoadipate aldolase/oxaloacetate decarboxylase n=1 Tax=Staphylococcus nepalensis TaxID=214473 RepID=A0A380GI96_9STAP|nr:hypothetical protein GCM10007203_21860 [Staphylococcus nepalensis]SUM53799.1 4-carboxy-4-hydroxy-2-oxoadipate aldolase/oxaloacetate decarboxylase [Staphylococcus nepalensis]VDG65723.1 demethylmenaquinone methyltransferase [Lacrimispora indolis]
MNIGCRIVQDFGRPDIELIKLFENIPVANIDDCMNRTGAISQKIRPLNTNFLLGTAFTVKVPEGDNLMFHKAMDKPWRYNHDRCWRTYRKGYIRRTYGFIL